MRKPFYFTHKKAWYVHIDGKLRRLNKDRKKAEEKYDQLMATDEINASVPAVRVLRSRKRPEKTQLPQNARKGSSAKSCRILQAGSSA